MVTVDVFYEDSKRWFTMVTYGKDVVNIPLPDSRYLVLGLQELSFQFPYEQVGIYWNHTCSHGRVVDL